MKLFEFLLYALATFRLAYFFSQENGPGWLSKRFRQWVSRKAPKKTHLDEGVRCPYCVSLWVAIALVLAFRFVHVALLDLFILVFAVGGGAILCHQAFVWLRRE